MQSRLDEPVRLRTLTVEAVFTSGQTHATKIFTYSLSMQNRSRVDQSARTSRLRIRSLNVALGRAGSLGSRLCARTKRVNRNIASM